MGGGNLALATVLIGHSMIIEDEKEELKYNYWFINNGVMVDRTIIQTGSKHSLPHIEGSRNGKLTTDSKIIWLSTCGLSYFIWTISLFGPYG